MKTSSPRFLPSCSLAALVLGSSVPATASATPTVAAEQGVPALPSEIVTVSIDLSGSEDANVFLANLQMDWDEECLDFDPITDSDNDGLPDSVRSRNASPNLLADVVFVNAEQKPAGLVIQSGDFSTTGPELLLDGPAFDVDFTVVCEPEPGEAVRIAPITITPFAVPRFPALGSSSAPAEFVSGSVAIGSTAPPAPEPIDLLEFADEAYSTVFSFVDVATAWIRSGDFAVIQTANANPSMAFADLTLVDHRVSFDVEVSNVHDNDFFGVAIGYQGGDVTNPDADYLLVDWKKSPEGPIPALSIDGEVTGLRLSRVTGAPDLVELFDHRDLVGGLFDATGGVEELAAGLTLGDVGWEPLTRYTISLEVRDDSLRVYVDGQLEVDYAGPVPAHGFAFYNGSLPGTQYNELVLEPL